MSDYPSMPVSVTERRIFCAVQKMKELAEELLDVHSHLTTERRLIRMPATTGKEAGDRDEKETDRPALSEDPFSSNLWRSYD